MMRAYVEQKAAELCTGAEIRLEHHDDSANQCIQIRGQVVVGYPAEEILAYVDEHKIDLVMMSTHGSSGIREWGLGEVANKVIHASHTPIWLVSSELREEVVSDAISGRPMVVPLADTRESETAIAHAVEIITQRGIDNPSELVFLHVVEGTQMMVDRPSVDQFNKERARMKAHLEELAQPVRQSGITVRTDVLALGDPAENIINYLKTNPTQLAVLATRGKKRINRMIFGSVAENIIHMIKATPLLLASNEN